MDSLTWRGNVLCPVLFYVYGSGSAREIAKLSGTLQK